MIIAYIAHPISGNVQENLAKIRHIVHEINLNEPGVVPFAPYYIDCLVLNDSIQEERERGIKNGTTLMKKGFVDEMRLYGDHISSGMYAEIMLALSLEMPIKPMSKEIKSNYNEFFEGLK